MSWLGQVKNYRKVVLMRKILVARMVKNKKAGRFKQTWDHIIAKSLEKKGMP